MATLKPAARSTVKKRTKKVRVQLLCHEDLVPKESIEGLSDAEISEWRAEFDVWTALRDIGYDVQVLGVPDDVEAIRKGVLEFRPDVLFNLTTEFHGAAHYDQHVVSYLELLKQNYTGCNPQGMTLARDKDLSKKILKHDGVPVPAFARFVHGRVVDLPPHLKYPLFIKSAVEEASLGISLDSIVHSDKQLEDRVLYIHEEICTDAIAEEYIDGREFYIGVLGNDRLKTFPLWELCIPKLPKGQPLIATRRIKWDVKYQQKLGVQNKRAEGLSTKLEREISAAAKQAYRSLGLSGYARLDLRLRPDNTYYFLEANPNPDITYGEDFAESAEADGVSYEELIDRIVKLGRSYDAGWK
ncbi:MAG: D-alanine-D-alanine ligase [Planctomycetota bacterium]|jgi:D-alanine-D-alanine ligase